MKEKGKDKYVNAQNNNVYTIHRQHSAQAAMGTQYTDKQ